jgi:hypothetical protein
MTESDAFQPDIAVFLSANLNLLTDEGLPVLPTWWSKFSPKTRRLDLENKERTYARLGVQEL